MGSGGFDAVWSTAIRSRLVIPSVDNISIGFPPALSCSIFDHAGYDSYAQHVLRPLYSLHLCSALLLGGDPGATINIECCLRTLRISLVDNQKCRQRDSAIQNRC